MKINRLFPYLKHYKNHLLFGFIFVTVSNICSTYLPRIVGRTIDMLGKGNFTKEQVLVNIGYLLALTAGSGLFMFLTRRTIIVASRLIEYDLRRDFLLSIEKQSINFFHKNPTGKLMAFVSNDISAAREFIGPAIMYGANTITTFCFAMYFMLKLNPVITLLALIPLPLIAVFTYFTGSRVHIAFKNVQEQFSKLTAFSQESFSGIRVAKGYNREEYESENFAKESKDYYKKNLRLARIYALMMPVFLVLVGLSLLIVLGYGGMLVIENKATLGDLTQFFIYLNLLIWPIAAIGWITNIIQRASASIERLGKIFDEVPDMQEKLTNKSLVIRGNINFGNISLKYDNTGYYSLSEINLVIPQGSKLGIIGPVGCGKSSFVNLIPRLYDVTSGELKIDGIDVRDIPYKNLRDSIGIVLQDPFLFSMTIRENIIFGKPDATDAEIEKAIKTANLERDIKLFPEGLNTMLGERGITLSGGQKQRLAIARAVLKNPAILILDDALSSVDTETEHVILNE
jgi:ATP-binding cassette, subfamily B, multidrug efflux pump